MEVIKIVLQVLGVVLVLIGVVVVYSAPKIVTKYKLEEKKQIDPDRVSGLDEDGLKKFKRETAILDVKIKGILVALPGAIMILVMYRI